jgi:hypothetical protein
MCSTCSEPMRHPLRNMHLTLNCEMCDSRIFQRILDSLRMVIVACYLMSVSCVSFIHDFNSVTLLFSGTPISSV